MVYGVLSVNFLWKNQSGQVILRHNFLYRHLHLSNTNDLCAEIHVHNSVALFLRNVDGCLPHTSNHHRELHGKYKSIYQIILFVLGKLKILKDYPIKSMGGGNLKRYENMLGWGIEQGITVHVCIVRKFKICCGGLKLVEICCEGRLKMFQVPSSPHFIMG